MKKNLLFGSFFLALSSLLLFSASLSVILMYPLFLSSYFPKEYIQEIDIKAVFIGAVIFGKIFGVIFLHKNIVKNSFVKTNTLVCFGHCLASFLFLFLFIFENDSFEFYYNISILISFVYSFLSPAIFILQSIYLFKIIPQRHHLFFSCAFACMWPLVGIISRYFAEQTNNISLLNIFTIFASNAFIAAFLFIVSIYFLKDFNVCSITGNSSKKVSFKFNFLIFVIGVICTIGLFFSSYILKTYTNEVLIIGFNNVFHVSYSHWLILLACIPLSGFVIHKTGIIKSMYGSFFILSLSSALLVLNPIATKEVLVVFQAVFSFALSMFLSSIYLIAHRTSEKTNSVYHILLFYVLGICTATIAEFYITKIKLSTCFVAYNSLTLGLMVLLVLFLLNKCRIFSKWEI